MLTGRLARTCTARRANAPLALRGTVQRGLSSAAQPSLFSEIRLQSVPRPRGGSVPLLHRLLSFAARDHYATLGVSRTATQQEIKRAYFNAAKRTHPDVDKSAGAAERFRSVAEAFDVLRDPARRRAYDAGGAASGSTTGNHSAQQPGGQRSQHYGGQSQQGARMGQASAEDLFKRVWSEMGFEEIDEYIAQVQTDFYHAADAALNKQTLAPARDFASEHKALLLGIALPAVVLFRVPAAGVFAIRLIGAPLLLARLLPPRAVAGFILPLYRVQWLLLSRLWVKAIKTLERAAGGGKPAGGGSGGPRPGGKGG
jgi:hypothetical protein